jgi:hypothetical protein
MGKMQLHVSKLLDEAGAKPMDLIRAGLSIGTAYRLARDDQGKGMEERTKIILIEFFTERLGRAITQDDIQTYVPD